jgi:flagellar biosynthesis/type III secretory pathway ATPase
MANYFNDLMAAEAQSAAAQKVSKEEQRQMLRKFARHLQSIRENVDLLDVTMQAVGYKPETEEEIAEIRNLLDILKDELGL